MPQEVAHYARFHQGTGAYQGKVYRRQRRIRIYRSAVLLGDAVLVSATSYTSSFSPGQLAEGGDSITARAFDGVDESAHSPALDTVLDTTDPRIVDGQLAVAINVRPAGTGTWANVIRLLLRTA